MRRTGLGRFDLHRYTGPRPVIQGEQCVYLDPIVQGEEFVLGKISDYQGQGWNVIEVRGSKNNAVFACPPGQLPREQAPAILESQVL